MQEDDDEAAAAAIAKLDVNPLMSFDLKVPPPQNLEPQERDIILKSSIRRIREGAADLVTSDAASGSGGDAGGGGTPELWMLLVVRMITRGGMARKGRRKGKEKAEGGEEEQDGEDERAVTERYAEQDRLRSMLYDYVMADFSRRYVCLLLSLYNYWLNWRDDERIQLATTWMNEEWYNDQLRKNQDGDQV
jgi:symplekin